MKLLVAVDPNVDNGDFLQYVGAQGWPPETHFHVIAVVEPVAGEWIPETIPSLAEKQIAHAAGQAEAAAARLRHAGTASAFVLEGTPHEILLAEAASLGADLILLGAPGRGSAWPHLRGATARKVLRHASCSVSICRGAAASRVMIATDGSSSSQKAALSIAGRPWPARTLFRVVSVVEPISASLRFLKPSYNDSSEATDLRAAAMGRAETAAGKAVETLRYAGLEAEEKVLVPVDTTPTLLLEEAVTWDAGLIVLGSHGNRGLSRFLIGSVSESVAMHAACSVEVVR